MDGKGWRLSFLVFVLILVVALGLKWLEGPSVPLPDTPEPTTESASVDLSLSAYFPALQGLTYYFAGEGMEYAAFSRYISFSEPGILQMEDANGTNLVQVVEYGPDEVKIIWVEEEFYENRSLLSPGTRASRQGRSDELVLLKAPLVKGNTWNDGRFQREVVSVDQIVTVPLGTFYDVVVVKNKSVDTDNFVQYEYYAKNIGLVKREALYVDNGETFAVVSQLKHMQSGVAQQ